MNILVTGGAGFLGRHLCKYLKDVGHSITIVDCLTYAADPEVVKEYEFVNKLCQSLNPSSLPNKQYDVLIHLASDSHVDNSIEYPRRFVESNVVGTLNMLEVARFLKIKTFVQMSTDEVTGPIAFDAPRTHEKSPMNTSSPYAASKAGAELLALSYRKTYGMDVRVVRSTNLYGCGQHPEKFLPRSITHGLLGWPIKVFGNGENRRSWLSVLDLCDGFDLVINKGKPGEVYSFGGVEHSNNNLAGAIAETLKVSVERVADRPGHDSRYSMDTSKVEALGWKRECSLIDNLPALIHWYDKNRAWWDQAVKRGGKWS